MATKNKLTLDFPMFETLKKQLNEAGGNTLTTAVENALTTSASYIDSQLKAAIAPHRRTGTVEQSLDTHPNKVEWSGTNASIQVGFNLDDGGIPSIFLMYGTKVHGQPHVQPDKKLYDAVYGSKNKRQVQKIQEEAFMSVAKKVIG